jgi:hypothetical protein
VSTTTAYQKPPHLRAPAAVADHGRKISRLEGSRDALVSQMNKTAPQAATALATANTAEAGVTAINTRLGAADMAFLALLGQMSHYNATNGGGWTTGGALGAGSWDATHASALTGWMNQVHADIAAILSRLQGESYMA